MAITTPTMTQAATLNMTPAQIAAAQVATPASVGPATQASATSVGQASQGVATTSADQLSGILNKGGALMQQSATTGNQQAASRGLLNSTMGIQAAQNAMIANAAPLAQTDANLLNNMSQFNAGAQNQQAQFNAGNQQQTNLANQQAQNQQAQFNAGNQQQTNLANQQAQNRVSEVNAGNQQQAAQLNQQQGNAQNQFNASQNNEAALKAMDVNSREQLAGIEANYKQLMQVNSSAGGLYEQVMKNISDIQNNKDIADKQGSIDSQLAWLRSGMGMIQNLNGVSGLVTF